MHFTGLNRVLLQRGQLTRGNSGRLPPLKRAQIYCAIAFYLDHQKEIDEYLARTERECQDSTIPLEQANPALWETQRPRAKMGEPRA